MVFASIIGVDINIVITLYYMVNIYCGINKRVIMMRRFILSQASALPNKMEVAAMENAKQGLVYFLSTYLWLYITLVSQSIGIVSSS